jgi:hypothetical protein
LSGGCARHGQAEEKREGEMMDEMTAVGKSCGELLWVRVQKAFIEEYGVVGGDSRSSSAALEL